ncbi:hypothetical protein [Xanthomonas citri]|nr:hypothetical protein [Xanthomonas citri]UZB10026.1 hypothetical protein OM953_10630 [Xanthomonas citri pv. fuscans]
MDIGVRVRVPGIDEGTPKHVWETEMLPRLRAALSAAPQGVEPAAYQYREDEAHNGFDDDEWKPISLEDYAAIKQVMQGNGPRKIAGGIERGDLRLAPHGCNTELRALYTGAQLQSLVSLVDQWRVQAATGGDGYDGPDYDQGVSETLLNCADDLAALLAAKPEPQA